jgi:hypothetical protein
LKRCPYCSELIEGNIKVCPHCGKNLQESTSVLLIILLLGFVITSYFVLPGFHRVINYLASDYPKRFYYYKLDNSRVFYKITGTATKASYSLLNPQGEYDNGEVTIPWKHEQTLSIDDPVSFTIQNKTNTGFVNCEIWVEEYLFFSNSTSIPYGTTSCEGIIQVRIRR